MKPSLTTKIVVAVLILIALSLIASLSALFISLAGGEIESGNTAVIPVEGVLFSGTGATPSGVITSDELIEDIDRAEESARIEAVIFLVNSPGGTAVASDEVVQRISRMEKPNVAVIREVGASGAYWIATATDRIFANRMSITGSIGVIGSYLSFGDFLDDWNVTYNRLVAGDLKDVGTPFRELEEDERAFLEAKMERIHDEFIAGVAQNRNLSLEAVRAVSDGRYLLGIEALDVGLVDQLGGLHEAESWLEEEYGMTVDTVLYEHKRSLLDILATVRSPTGITDGVMVPMAK